MVCIFILAAAVKTNASFAKIAAIMETVSSQTSVTSTEALDYVQQTTTALHEDYLNSDPELACSVVEGAKVMKTILDYLENDASIITGLVEIAAEMAKLTAKILDGICKTFCIFSCDGTCPMSIFHVSPIVTSTDDCLLRILRLVVDRLDGDIVEIYGEITLSAYKMRVQDIYDKEKIFNTLSIPPTPENLAVNSTYANTTVIFMMLTFKNSFYSFMSDPFGVNGGIYKTYLLDLEGKPVEIFNIIDYFVDAHVDPYDQSNVLNQPINGSENLEASFDFGSESGMVSVVLASLQTCTTSVSSVNNTFDIVTRGANTTLSDGSPPNINVHFSDQTISFTASPPNPPMDVFVHCEACMQMADIIFMLDGSGSVGLVGFSEIRNFTMEMISTMALGPNKVRVGIMVFGTDSDLIFHLGDYYDMSTIEAIINAIPFPSSLTYTGQAMSMVKDTMLPLARPNVQRLIFLITDGSAMDSLLLYQETDAMKSDGVEIACIGINLNYGLEQFLTVASDPDEVYFIQVPNFSQLGAYSASLINNICAGLWTNLTSNQIRAGKLSMYAMNSATNQWEVSPGVKLKTMEDTTVVFESNFFGSFGVSVMAIPPETIDFNEVFTDFDDKIADNAYVLAMNGILLAALVVGTVIMRKKDLEDKRMWQYKPLADNIEGAKFTYYISVHTGFWSSFKLSAVPYIILKGWYGETTCRPLVDKSGLFRNLIRWRCSNFLLKTDIELGPLSELRIWHDNTGENNNLFLDKVLISTGNIGEIHVFFCNDWLSENKGDGKTHRILYCAQSEFKDGNTLFSSITRFRLFDEHLLLSLFGRPSFSRFSRVQRLYTVAAIMSLSFLASAMFFRAGENTHIHGIKIGPVKMTYKQLYVGFVTSFMTFPVGFLMGFVFRNRRFKPNLKDATNISNITKDTGTLPWFVIFIGYGAAGGALASGMFFTTLYSIQWGADVSLDWMMSILFGTTNGVMLFDPFKVVAFALVIALVFKGFARKEIEIMAPFYEDTNSRVFQNISDVPFYSKWPGDNKETNALAEMRRRLKLDQKLTEHFKSIVCECLFVALLGMICSHCVVTEAYLQNDQLINQLKPIKKLNDTDDFYEWMFYKYLTNIYPRRQYNSDVKSPEERKFMSDVVSYRMGPIRLRQIRTKGECDIPGVMKETILQCTPKLTKETEETENYCPGWTEYDPKCDESGFTYMTSKETETFMKLGEFDSYGGGGYVRDFNPFSGDVYYEMYKLKRDKWIDNRTRFISSEHVVANVNTMLFSLVTFVIELPVTGGLYLSSQVMTSRLYPYVNSWDYLVLAAQLIFVLITFIRTVYFIYEAWKMKSKCLKSIPFWGTVLSLLLSYTAIACYIARIDRTIVIIEKIFNSAGKFMSFELVQLLDDIYKGCIGVVLFIAILGFLKALSFNYYIYLMKTAIGVAKTDVASFGLLAAIILSAFASFVYVVMGSSSYQFRDFFNTFGALFRMMLAMVTFRDKELTENAQSNIIFSFFIFLMAILMVNVFICILNDAFAVVKSSWNSNPDIEPFDEELNEHFWWKIGQAFNFCSSKQDQASKYQADAPGDVNKDLNQLDEMIKRLFRQTSNAQGAGYKN